MDIHEALELIHEWVQSLGDEELPEQCRQDGNDFFSFLKRKGFNPGVFVVAVERVTGHRPQNLWRVNDADLLRQAIAGYHSTKFELSHEEYRDGQSDNQWLQDATDRYFS